MWVYEKIKILAKPLKNRLAPSFAKGSSNKNCSFSRLQASVKGVAMKPPFIQPTPLQAGDKVAILSPSSGLPYLFPWVYEQGLARIRELFFLDAVEFPTARMSPEYLAANPQARAEDINRAFQDPSIKGIIATIGGNDQVRILPYLDKESITQNPKIFMGYSDCTNVHLFLWNLGIISYYGGAVMTQFAMGDKMHEYTVQAIFKALFHPPIGFINASANYTDADLDWAIQENIHKARSMYPCGEWIWHNCNDEVLEGVLWGGCLEILHLHLAIRKYLPDPRLLDGAVLFVETSEEMPGEGFVYRFFAALAELGMLQKFRAVLVGIPKAQFCEKEPPEGRAAFIANQQTAVMSALGDYGITIPVIFHMNFGHTDPQLIIPSGGRVKIDCTAKTVELL